MDTGEANVPFPGKEWTPVRPTCRNLVTNGHPVAEKEEEGPLIRGPRIRKSDRAEIGTPQF